MSEDKEHADIEHLPIGTLIVGMGAYDGYFWLLVENRIQQELYCAILSTPSGPVSVAWYYASLRYRLRDATIEIVLPAQP